MEQFSKLSLDGGTIGARMTEKNKNKNKKSEKMGAKFVRTTSSSTI